MACFPLGQLKVKTEEIILHDIYVCVCVLGWVCVCTKLSHEGSPCRWLLILVQFAYIQSGSVIGEYVMYGGRQSVPGCNKNSLQTS